MAMHGWAPWVPTANEKLANLYWPSRKRSPKWPVVLVMLKKWRGTTEKRSGVLCPPLSNSFWHHWFLLLTYFLAYLLTSLSCITDTCDFQESMLNGRIEPTGAVEGFTVDVGASGSFCPKHISLPVAAFFFTLSDDNAPSPYLVHERSLFITVSLLKSLCRVLVRVYVQFYYFHC